MIYSNSKTDEKLLEKIMSTAYGLKESICCFMNFELNSAQRKIHFQVKDLFPLKLHLLAKHKILAVISSFSKIAAFSYLGASQFGFPPIIQKK